MAEDRTDQSRGWANKGDSQLGTHVGRLEVNTYQPGSRAKQGRVSARPETAESEPSGMDDSQTMRSIVRDDAYTVVRVLADGPAGRTELVTLDDEGPLVRKRIPSNLANVSALAVAMEVDEPLLPRIEELYRMPDALVVVYDYVPGKSLRELVGAEGRMSAARASDIICDVCRSVGVLHEHGVIHRDITPGNVIAASDGAHLVDLGIARQRNEGQRRDTTTLGTWGFAAPEQYGFAQTDARSDVYGIGRLLGYLLTGVTPGDDAYEQALDKLPQGQDLVQVVRKATEFEPSARYQTAAEMADAVRAAALQPTPAPAVKTPEPTMHKERAFAEVPVWLRVLAIILWIFVGGFALLTVMTSIAAFATGNPPWEVGHQALALSVVAFCVAVCRETYLAITLAEPYARANRPVVHYVLALFTFFGVLVLALAIIAALMPPQG